MSVLLSCHKQGHPLLSQVPESYTKRVGWCKALQWMGACLAVLRLDLLQRRRLLLHLGLELLQARLLAAVRQALHQACASQQMPGDQASKVVFISSGVPDSLVQKSLLSYATCLQMRLMCAILQPFAS